MSAYSLADPVVSVFVILRCCSRAFSHWVCITLATSGGITNGHHPLGNDGHIGVVGWMAITAGIAATGALHEFVVTCPYCGEVATMSAPSTSSEQTVR